MLHELAYMLGNGARIIIVENASRFARDLILQGTGYQSLKAKGIDLIAADSPDGFVSDPRLLCTCGEY